MYRLFKKNELYFSLAWILAYVVLSSIANNLSDTLGITKIITAPVTVVFALFLYSFIRKNNMKEYVGLCRFKGSPKDYLLFIPLLIIMSTDLWNGAAMRFSALETVLYVLCMLFTGFIEEVIFRGFLFKALCKDNIKQAIVISSITFGLGHIANLLNGRDLLPTLLQICYAAAIGFLFSIMVYKGKGLWPCIITHSVFNGLSTFAVANYTVAAEIITSVILCIISIGYALWILAKTKSPNGNEVRQ